MINMFRILRNFLFPNEIIEILRFPAAKRLRPHLLGLTTGLFFTLIYLIFNFSAIFSKLPWFVPFLTFFIVIAGTFFWWTFLAFLLIVVIFRIPIDPQIIKLYCWAYFSGLLFAIIYNDLVYLYLWLFENDAIKIVFAFNPRKKVNIIKSPKINEETVQTDSERCLYHFTKSDATDFHPYTIVFWANKTFYNKKTQQYLPDPINRDLTLFLRSVEKALSIFEKNEVLGRPEIWSKIRIIAIFEGMEVTSTSQANSYAQSAQFMMNGELIENLITPAEDLNKKYDEFIKTRIDVDADTPAAKDALEAPVDVFIILSAVDNFTRATSLFSDVKGISDPTPVENRSGIAFDFSYRTYDINEYRNNGKYQIIPVQPTSEYDCIHDHYAQIPGRVAINVKTAALKTYIHEFAHAMSSARNGVIVDEYFDDGDFQSDVAAESTNNSSSKIIPFCVNRFIRQNSNNNKWLPIPHIFAVYCQTPFISDLEHPSANEKWIGYFPERHRKDLICTMDASFCTYRFDDLVAAFMYDRFITKINRP